MSDKPTWAQPGWRGGAHDAIAQELAILGPEHEYDAKALADGAAKGSPFAQKKLKDLLTASDEAKLGQFKGSGWSQDQIAELQPGRTRNDFYGTFYPGTTSSAEPTPRELSPGDKQKHEWVNRRKFLDTLTDPPKPDKAVSAWTGPVRDQAKFADSARQMAYEEYLAELGRTHGTSGALGALENPEYTAGRVMTKFLDPMSNAAKYYGRGDANSIAEALRMASDYAGLQEAGNAVSPILPGNSQTAQEREQAHGALRQATAVAAPKAYRDYYREQTGEYPSWLREAAVEFGANMIDPTTAVFAPFALGRGAMAAAKVAKTSTLIPRLAALAGGAGAALANETLEEIPLYAGLTAAFNPPPANPLSSDRPDLPQYRKTLGHDLEFQQQSEDSNEKRKAALEYYRQQVFPIIEKKNAYQNAGYGAM